MRLRKCAIDVVFQVAVASYGCCFHPRPGWWRRVADPDIGLDVLQLTECSSRDSLMLMELFWMLTIEQDKVESGMVEVCRLEEPVRTSKEDEEGFFVASAGVEEMTADVHH